MNFNCNLDTTRQMHQVDTKRLKNADADSLKRPVPEKLPSDGSSDDTSYYPQRRPKSLSKEPKPTRHFVKVHRCDVCKKVFKDASNFRKHKRIHTGEKPFTCQTCGKKFSDPSSKNTHQLTHNNISRRNKSTLL